MSRAILFVLCGAALAAASAPASARQTPQRPPDQLLTTPFGATPPLGPPMPASRDNHYWGFRGAWGTRTVAGTRLHTVAGGVDLQWRGGSVFGFTTGYQLVDCDDDAITVCDSHLLFGLRGRLNVLTAGSELGEAFGDYSSTATFGAEVGIGYAPDVDGSFSACTLDVGVPISIGFLGGVRIVPFLTPQVGWEVDCSEGVDETTARFAISYGVGLQQIGLRGLDVYLGAQKVFGPDIGQYIGLSVSYIILH